MTNLYERKQFGGIPTCLFDLDSEQTKRENIFVCELLDNSKEEKISNLFYLEVLKRRMREGYKFDGEVFNIAQDFISIEFQKKGVEALLKEEYPLQLYIDSQKIDDCILSTENQLESILIAYVCKYLSNCKNVDYEIVTAFDYRLNTLKGYELETCFSIGSFLYKDYLRMIQYNKSNSNKEGILRERELEMNKLFEELIDTYFPPKSQLELEIENYENSIIDSECAIDGYTDWIADNKIEIEELQKKINDLQKEIDDCYISIESSKSNKEKAENALQDLLRLRDNNQIQEQCNKSKEDNTLHNTSKKATAKAYIQKQEKIRQEIENATQCEESSIPEKIRRKARYFLDKGYIEKKDNHYILLQGLTGQEFAQINKEKRKEKGLEYFSIKEMTSYIWSRDNLQYSENTYKNPKDPKISIED